MVSDAKAFDAILVNAELAGYESMVDVGRGETHNSIFPYALTRGLRVLHGFKAE